MYRICFYYKSCNIASNGFEKGLSKSYVNDLLLIIKRCRAGKKFSPLTNSAENSIKIIQVPVS